MLLRTLAIPALLCLAGSRAIADELLYRYEGNVVPYDASAGWEIYNPCEDPCSESVDDGHFVLRWPQAGDLVNYQLWVARPPEEPPATLWVEWRFRSNHPLGPNFYTCDANFKIQYATMFEVVFMYGDAAISASGDDFIGGLGIDEFHTYRFESVDGYDYEILVDGQKFVADIGSTPNTAHAIALRGSGGCTGDQIPNMVNEWDFVRYGTISYGEQIVASDPSGGLVDAAQYPDLDRFTVTFDSANYVYIDEITVETTVGDAPVVVQTRRRENDEPDTVQIVLDRPLPVNATTRFTFDDGVAVNVIEYTLAYGDRDGDGVTDDVDNCPDHPNSDQADCDHDGTGDVCTMAECGGQPSCSDCNSNNVPDACDIDGPTSSDCNTNGVPDECDIAECGGDPACSDCNANGVPDSCDIEGSTSSDCNANMIPDDCEEDSDGDGLIDECDGCPDDPGKTSPGLCGCGVSDIDSDSDTIPDCNDRCPGEDDRVDDNGNGTPDCLEHGPIPTVSQGGIILLALALLVLGRLYFRRRRSVPS